MGSRSLTLQEFARAIRRRERFEVLFLKGEEEFLLRRALREYIAAVMPPDAAAFDFNELRATDVSKEVLWNALTTLPLLSERRLVVLDLSRSVEEGISETIARYVARPSPSTSFVMVWVTANKGETKSARIGGETIEVEFGELKAPQRITWARKYLAEQGKRIDEEAGRYLIEISSSSTGDIAAKLNHASLFLGEGEEVTVPVLMQVAGVTSEYTVFNLEDAILSRRVEEAQRIARSLLDGGEPLLRLVALHRTTMIQLWRIARVIRKSRTWQDGDEGKKTWQDIRNSFGRKAFKIDGYIGAARSIGEAGISEAVSGLLDLEIRAKSSPDASGRYFEWLWKLCSANRSSVGTGVYPNELTG
ncbi:DNA polymerase III subunit delta [bacterium]|nr:DNA polymerase III subunit delta [bacterium]MBU1985285.1 DNA polymerase III subunit delta [bacterium]